MSDQSASGSRWEPTADEQAARSEPEHDTVPAHEAATDAPAGGSDRTPTRRRTSTLGVAGIAAALLLAGGGGGFALGHLVTHDRPSTSVDGRGFDPDGDHHGLGDPGQGPPANLQPQNGTDDSGGDDT